MATSAQEWWERAQRVIPGGVNSPVRSFKNVGGAPFLVRSGRGAYVTTEDGRTLVDYVMSWGPLLLGHAHPAVVEAASKAAADGLSFGAPTVAEVERAEMLCGALPGFDVVRMVNSGTEATMSALRVARAATGRSKVVKFTGCYHGHHDSLLIRAGSGAATFGVPDSAGVPERLAELTMTVPYNDLGAVRQVFREWGPEIAAVIVEPVAGNMGTVLPEPGFLEDLRRFTQAAGSLLIFDEVMTGFRVGWAGAAGYYGVRPDLVTLAKVIGAGLPVGAYGGKREYMQLVAPLGPVYQAGTLSGNPLAMAGGLAQLRAIGGPAFYPPLAEKTAALARGLEERGRRRGVAVAANSVGGMMTLFFADRAPKTFAEVEATDRGRYRKYFHGMLDQGIFLPPSAFETVFVSAAHEKEAIEHTLEAADTVFARI